MRTRLLHAKETLAHLHLATAVARRTSFGRCSRLCASTMAWVALVPSGDTNFSVFAFGGFFERYLHRITQVIATVDLTATSTATCLSKNITKNIAKRFTKSTSKLSTAWAPAHIGIYACMAVLVVGCAFLWV